MLRCLLGIFGSTDFEARPLDGAPEKINGKVETQPDVIHVIIQRFTAIEVGTY